MSSGGFHSLFSGSSKVGSFFATDTDVPHVDIAIANPYVFFESFLITNIPNYKNFIVDRKSVV